MSKLFTTWRLVSLAGMVSFGMASCVAMSQCGSVDNPIEYICVAAVLYLIALVFICIGDLNTLMQKLDEVSVDIEIVEQNVDSLKRGN